MWGITIVVPVGRIAVRFNGWGIWSMFTVMPVVFLEESIFCSRNELTDVPINGIIKFRDFDWPADSKEDAADFC